MSYIDYKVTTWNRIHYSDTSNIDKLKEMLINGDSPNDLTDDNLGFVYHENLFDTDEYISPEENQGSATIELYDNEKKMIWSNEIDYNSNEAIEFANFIGNNFKNCMNKTTEEIYQQFKKEIYGSKLNTE